MANLKNSIAAIYMAVVIPLISVSQDVKALSYERAITFREAVNLADVVVVGTVGNIESYFTAAAMPASKIRIETASVLSNGVAVPLNKGFEFYIYGGVFLAPENSASKKYIMEYIEGAPALSSGDELLILVKGNGERVLPFVGTSHSVLKINRAENAVVDEEGAFLTSINENGQLRFTKAGMAQTADVQLLFSSSEKPPLEVNGRPEIELAQPLDITLFINQVANWRTGDLTLDVENTELPTSEMYER